MLLNHPDDLQDGRERIQSGRVSDLPAASVATARAAGQPLSCTSASAGKQEWDELEAAASPLPPQATGTAGNHHPQYMLSSLHKASADAELQQPDGMSHPSSHSVTGLQGLDAGCASTSQQQQRIPSHLSGPLELHGDGKEHQGSCCASSPDPVQATDRALLEHCAAGRYNCSHEIANVRQALQSFIETY